MELQVIQNMIYEIRGQKVMLDRDLAKLYGVETKALKRSVKNNMKRFPEDFMFVLTREEWESLRCKNCTSNNRGGVRYLPFAFTEQGVAMLSGLLNSDTAVNVNISIMRAFVSVRRILSVMPDIKDEIETLKRKMEELERCTLEAVNDLSEDTRNELDDIYLALAQLASKQKSAESARKRIGYK